MLGIETLSKHRYFNPGQVYNCSGYHCMSRLCDVDLSLNTSVDIR